MAGYKKSLTSKQELFARSVASGKSQAAAYRSAYDVSNSTPATVYSKASILMADVNISSRVAELRAPLVAEVQMTLASHLADLQMLRDLAMSSGQHGAAITAEVARGKASGVAVDRLAITGEVNHSIRVRFVNG